MSAPNHTGLFLEELHHTLRGMLDGLAAMQVSPVSMLQCTLMASSALPWFGSTQYSPTQTNWSACGRTWNYKHVADDLFCSWCDYKLHKSVMAYANSFNTPIQVCHSSVKSSRTFLLLWLPPTLTTLLHWVAPLQVVTGPGGMLPAAVWALHAVDLAAEGLQCGLDARVHRNYGGGVAVGQSFIFAELRRRRRARVVILRAAKEVVYSRHGRTWGTRGARWSRLSWRALLI